MTHLGRTLSALLLLLLLTCMPRSARADAEPDFQQWFMLWTSTKLPHQVLFDLDLQARRMNAPLAAERDDAGALLRYQQNPSTTLIVRPFVGYALAPWASLWLGYAWVPVYFDAPEQRGARNVSEHRVFQQLSLAMNIQALNLSSRTRLEQRFRDNGPGSAENDAGMSHWAHRVRQMFRAAYTVPGQPWMLIAWDELFFHLNDTNYPTRPGVDQNRAFVGLGYQPSDAFRLEVGYLNQYVRRYTDPHQINHALFTMIVVKLDPFRPAQPAP